MVMEEYTSLKKNKTWVLTTLLNGGFVVGHKWVFKLQLKSNDCIDHFENFIAKGYSQVGHGCIDYEEKISLAKITSIRTLMTIVVERDLELHEMDVKIVFLKENIYMQQLKGYVKLGREHLVCKLRKTLYGLKQSSKAWYKWTDSYILKDKFKKNNVDTYVYIKSKEEVHEMLMLYIDDVIITNNNLSLLQQTKKYLFKKFEMVNMGPLQYFLGIQVQMNRTTRTIHLH